MNFKPISFNTRSWYGFDRTSNSVFRFMLLKEESTKALPHINQQLEKWLEDDEDNRFRVLPNDYLVKRVNVWKSISEGIHRGEREV